MPDDAIDPRLERYCRLWAARHTGWDREDVAAEGILGAVRSGTIAGPLSHAILDARRAMARRVLAGARDRARQVRWAGGRPVAADAPDPCLPDVAQALATLDARQRSILWLGIGLGWSWADVGDSSGCSSNAAKMTAYRALARLREEFAG